MEDFCCGVKSSPVPELSPQSLPSPSWRHSDSGSSEPAFRTDTKSGYGDPGGGGEESAGAGDRLHPPHLENKSIMDLKRSQQCLGPSGGNNNSLIAPNSYPQGTATSGGQTHYQGSHHLPSHPIQPHHTPQLTSPPHPDTDSALEAAVNSILEC